MIGRRGGSRRSIVLGALAVPWLAGCTLLGYPPDWDEGEFPEPSVVATYREGSATIGIPGGDTLVLDQVASGSTLTELLGATVRWTGPDGWNMRLVGGQDVAFMPGAYLQFDRIVDGQHWTTWDPSRCIVDIEVADKNAVRGTASCKKVEWYDALDQGFGMTGEENPLDVPTFDAEVTFEALP